MQPNSKIRHISFKINTLQAIGVALCLSVAENKKAGTLCEVPAWAKYPKIANRLPTAREEVPGG